MVEYCLSTLERDFEGLAEEDWMIEDDCMSYSSFFGGFVGVERVLCVVGVHVGP